MKNILTILCLSCFVLHTSAQDTSFSSKYESKTILMYGNRYTINGKKISQNQLEWTMDEFETSRKEYKQFEKYNGKAALLALLTVGCYVTAITQVEKNPNLALGFGIAGLTANIIGIPIGTKGRKHLQKAIWFYNRDVLK